MPGVPKAASSPSSVLTLKETLLATFVFVSFYSQHAKGDAAFIFKERERERARVHAARIILSLLSLLDIAAVLLAVSVKVQGCSLKFGPSLLKTFGRLLEFSEAEISRL